MKKKNRHKLPKKSECPFHGCWNNGKFSPGLAFFCIGHSDDKEQEGK